MSWGAVSGDLGAIVLKSCEGAMDGVYYRLVKFVYRLMPLLTIVHSNYPLRGRCIMVEKEFPGECNELMFCYAQRAQQLRVKSVGRHCRIFSV